MTDKIKVKYAELSDKIYINGSDIDDIEKFERAYSYILDDVAFYTYDYDEEEINAVLEKNRIHHTF